jgi:hypothetical protein
MELCLAMARSDHHEPGASSRTPLGQTKRNIPSGIPTDSFCSSYGATIVGMLATPVAPIAVTATSSESLVPNDSVVACPDPAGRSVDDHLPSRPRA